MEQTLKWVGIYASLNQNIYVTVDPTPVDIDHAAHKCGCIGFPKCLLSES